MQFQQVQLYILMVPVIMPLTDLPTFGLIAVIIYGLVTCLILVPYNFMDVILLEYEKIFKDQGQMQVDTHGHACACACACNSHDMCM